MEAPGLTQLLKRAIRLRCPWCGIGKLFNGMFRMETDCPGCRLRFERSPGFFLGSTYINYGVTSVTITVAYVWLHFGQEWPNRTLTPALIAFCVIFPMLFFRYARAIWLAIDCGFDPPGNGDPDP